jgi:hypothetical protein
MSKECVTNCKWEEERIVVNLGGGYYMRRDPEYTESSYDRDDGYTSTRRYTPKECRTNKWNEATCFRNLDEAKRMAKRWREDYLVESACAEIITTHCHAVGVLCK